MIVDLVGDILRQKPSLSEYEHRCLIVSGIPVVGDDRFARLKNVLGKIFGKLNADYTDYYPLDNNKTKDYCFVLYPTTEIAEHAAAVLDNYLLDRNHKFRVNLFDDIHKFTKIDESWQPPAPRPFNDLGDLWSWLQSDKCYDQLAIHYEREANLKGSGVIPHVGVYEYRKGKDPILMEERQNWTETVFKWSPYGTFLTSVHRMGVVLWAGEKFNRFNRFQHENVMMVDFSPCERFLITYSPPSEKRWRDDPNSLRIFEIETGEMRRGMMLDNTQMSSWPYFQWSFDEKYFACIKPGGNGISVYETENFTLMDKKHVQVDGLRSFKWSPTRPYLAYYCEERSNDNAPAEIGIMEFPSKIKLRAQRIFSVSDAELFWNKNGDRLAAHTERYQKKIVKTSEEGDIKYIKPASYIEIFDARGKDVSVLTLPLNEPYIAFGWEPAGDRFCLLVGSQHKSTPLIYHLDPSKHVPQLLSKFESADRFSNVLWSPVGGWLVVYSASSSSGNIMFIDGNGPEPSRTNLVEYPGFDKGSWDPTGRFFSAASTISGGKGDMGYRIYTFQGRELYRKGLDRLIQFKWRPRLPIKLSDDTVKMIRKNLKSISAKFEEEDKLERGKATKEVSEKRKKIMAEFKRIVVNIQERYCSEEKLRMKLRGGFDTSRKGSPELVEETITVALSTEKIKIKELSTVPEEE
ncbi:unnamed protein product [Dracunculus medinensis]|uniref:Eukaryotic translation initiation factor 3 subunit B n=1 Tax=Dracunculus medinensis TaxID=318479 RepID=A0A158Q5X5_DRAME|nr:unnamed protein product [Dracunculus medinensis]